LNDVLVCVSVRYLPELCTDLAIRNAWTIIRRLNLLLLECLKRAAMKTHNRFASAAAY